MTNNIIQMLIAVALFLTLIFIVLRYVKPRRNQAEFIVELLNKLCEADRKEEGDICKPKRKS
jgi:hypothetical protein